MIAIHSLALKKNHFTAPQGSEFNTTLAQKNQPRNGTKPRNCNGCIDRKARTLKA